jgi:cell division protein FtsA
MSIAGDTIGIAEDVGKSGRRTVKGAVTPSRGGIIAALDVGTGKICCFIARVGSRGPQVIGVGHQVSRGIRNGIVVDLDEASRSVMSAVHAAEQMAGETIDEVVVNLSGGFLASRIVDVDVAVAGSSITDADIRHVLALGHQFSHQPGPQSRGPADREVIHSIPVGFSLDGSRGIRDPRGMSGRKLGITMNIVSAKPATLRNLNAAIGRCHLDIAGLVVSPYASGLAALVEDEMDLGVTLIDMGAGTTTIGVFFDRNLIFADQVPVGGAHVTADIARGLSTPLAHAERLKTLHGSAMASSADEREAISVPQIGEDDDQHVHQIPKSILVGIIAPRLEETFELVRSRLEASGYDKIAGRRVVLTGGASQLPGIRELAGIILDKQIRIGRPLRVAGLAEALQGPAFATCAGLLHFALSERAEPPRPARSAVEPPASLLVRVGRWLKENF